MTLNQLRHVIVVSETGSLNKAAEQLYESMAVMKNTGK